jgi:hypothetical protein
VVKNPLSDSEWMAVVNHETHQRRENQSAHGTPGTHGNGSR